MSNTTTPTEIRQQFLLEFTRTIVETLAAQKSTIQNIPIQSQEITMSAPFQPTAFPISPMPETHTFIIPSQAKTLTHPAEAPRASGNSLKTILEDSTINAIECQGPNKPLVLRKQGATVLSSISLSEAEIQEQIKKWAENTNHNLTNGILRADNENLTITAVISELIGSRFMVIRKLNARVQ